MNSNSNIINSRNSNGMILPLTDSSDESSIDQNPASTHTTNVMRTSHHSIQKSEPIANTSIVNTTMSFEEDGSVVVDLAEDDDDHHRRIRNEPVSRALFNENDIMVPPPNHPTSSNELLSPSPYPPKRTRNQRWLPVVLGMAMLLCFACGIYFFWQSKQTSSSRNSSSKNGENTTPITKEELALHSDVTNDCWILIDDTVYDVTQYAPTHPGGGEYVTDFCGSNATKDFYINHPQEYLQIYLSSNTRMGVISTNTNTTTTTTTTGGNKNNNNSNGTTKKNTTTTTNEEKDDSGNENENENEDGDDDNDDDGNNDDNNDDDSTKAPTTAPLVVDAPTTSTTTSPPVVSCISIDEVLLHSSTDDCYYILYNYVYDFTNYIDLHPGGARKVFHECGTDATAVYETEKFHNEDLLLEVNAVELYGLGYAC